MANISFSYGTFSNLKNLIGTTRSDEAGTFYVATDNNHIALADPVTGIVGWVNNVVYQKALLSSYVAPAYPAGTIVVISGSTAEPSEDGIYITDGVTAIQLDNLPDRIHELETAIGALPTTDTKLSTSAVSLTTNSGIASISHTITDTSGKSVTSIFNVTGTEGVSVSTNGSTITITGGSQAIIDNIYDYVDQALQNALGDLDAMKFKGVISVDDFNNLSMTTNSFESGWAYKFSTSGKCNGANQMVDVGDMVIMSKRESGEWIYNIIPSGDETDVYYTPHVDTDKKLYFTDSTGATIATYTFAGQNGIAITGTTNSAGKKGQTLTVSLATVTAPTIPTGDYISNLTFDDYGRVATVSKATLPSLQWKTFGNT